MEVKLYDFRVEAGREDGIVGFKFWKIINHSKINLSIVIPFIYFQFGLTLDKTNVKSDAMNPFIDDHQDKCILEEPASMQHNGPIAYLNFDLNKKQ